MAKHDLQLDETICRYLFASPAHFVGECAGPGFYLTHAFASWGHREASTQENRGSTFALSVRTEQRSTQSVRVETYEWVGDEASSLLGAFFGKLIHNLGHIQCGSIQTVPSTILRPIRDKSRPPFNSLSRRPGGPEINLVHADRVIQKYVTNPRDERLQLLLRASEFYRTALDTLETRPEVALAMLCSTLEALLPLKSFTEDELYDDSLKATFKEIAKSCKHGSRIVQGLKSRLFQIRRKVVALVNYYLPEAYFEQHEAAIDWMVPKDRDELLFRIKHVYDMRSTILHTGNVTGLWYLQQHHQNSEVGVGSPVLGERDLEKTLSRSLNLTGMERVTSTILRCAISEWLDCPDENDSNE